MSWFAMDYFLQFNKSYLVNKHHVSLPKDKGSLKNMEIGTWHQIEYTSKFPVAPRIHIGFLIFYQTLCYFKKFPIRLMWMVGLFLFIEKRRVFGLHFLYWQKFVKLRILNRPRMKLVFWPPSNSKRFLIKDMIPKVNSKNICSRLVLFGVMLMKIYYLGNWVNNRCLWNKIFQL